MQTKYRALRIIIVFYQIIAIILLGLGIVVGGFLMVSPTLSFQIIGTDVQTIEGPPAVGTGIGVLVAGFLLAVGLFVFAQLIQVLLDIEANTRPKIASSPRDGIQRLPR